MEIFLFTVAGILLYFVSDWILLRIEDYFGRRLEYRTLVFFAIILVLSISLFNLIQFMQGGSGGDTGSTVTGAPATGNEGGTERAE